MTDIWARHLGTSAQLGADYWGYFAQRLANLAAIPEGAAVLDVGTSDGNVLFKAMRKAGPRGRGVGMDIWGDGLQDGLREAQKQQVENVAFAQMDAGWLGFPSETFHSVLANFVAWAHCFDFERMEQTAPDPRLPEIWRVLKPGGQVGIGTWLRQHDLDWLVETFLRYLPEHAAAAGESLCAYAKENPEGYRAMLRASGFDDIRVCLETATFVSPDAETWWQQMERAAGRILGRIPDAQRLEWIREQVLADVGQFTSSKGIQFEKTAAFVFARKQR